MLSLIGHFQVNSLFFNFEIKLENFLYVYRKSLISVLADQSKIAAEHLKSSTRKLNIVSAAYVA